MVSLEACQRVGATRGAWVEEIGADAWLKAEALLTERAVGKMATCMWVPHSEHAMDVVPIWEAIGNGAFVPVAFDRAREEVVVVIGPPVV